MSATRWPTGAALVLAAATLAPPGPARAWAVRHTQSGAVTHWPAFPVSFEVDASGAPDADRRAVLRCLRRGPEAWTLPGKSAASFRYAGPATGAFSAGDGVDEIAWITQGWPATLGDPTVTAAATLLTYDVQTGEIHEADIGVNAQTFRFAAETPANDALDLWSIAAHESGHALGLAHSCDGPAGTPACDAAPPVVTASVMYPNAVPGDTGRRVPNADDLAGLASIYGDGTTAPPDGKLAKRQCAGDPVVFEPDASAPPATAFELVDADTGEVHAATATNTAAGVTLDLSGLPQATFDVVAIGASGKARAFYDAVTPLPPCGAGGCSCSATATSAGAVFPALLAALGLKLAWGRR